MLKYILFSVSNVQCALIVLEAGPEFSLLNIATLMKMQFLGSGFC